MIEKKQTYFLMALTFLFTFLGVYTFCGNSYKTDMTVLQRRITAIQSEEQSVDTHYKITVQELQSKNDSLQQLVDTRKVELAKAVVKTKGLETEVSQLAAKVLSTPDTAKERGPASDSLATHTLLLIKQSDKRDSLCDETVNGLNMQLVNADSLNSLCSVSYAKMKEAVDTSIQQQQNMNTVIKSLDRKLKRKAFANKALSVTVMVLTGVTATLLLLHP